MTRFDPATGEPIQVTLRGGRRVDWTRTVVGPDLPSFDPGAVTVQSTSVTLREPSRGQPGAARVNGSVEGLPSDASRLELVVGISTVVWGDGTRGTVRAFRARGSKDEGWSVEIETTAPPEDSRIRSLSFAVDLIRSPRLLRWEARFGVGEGASFDFGSGVRKWILSGDMHVTEFRVARHESNVDSLPDREQASAGVVGIRDAEGRPFRNTSGSGAGSISILEWVPDFEPDPVLPVRVTVEAPLVISPTRLVLRLEDLQPRR